MQVLHYFFFFALFANIIIRKRPYNRGREKNVTERCTKKIFLKRICPCVSRRVFFSLPDIVHFDNKIINFHYFLNTLERRYVQQTHCKTRSK